jgi:hypothetical protein
MMKNAVLLFLVALLVIVVVPGTFVAGQFLQEPLRKAGIDINENFRGGALLGDFPDQEGDLLRAMPPGSDNGGDLQSLDLVGFQVRKVAISSLAGIGIQSRLNLVFRFRGKAGNPASSDLGFSVPVMHVYMKVPGQGSPISTSDKAVDAVFEGGPSDRLSPWDYEVILDGFHGQARVFDTKGNQVGKGLNVFVAEVEGTDPAGAAAATDMGSRKVEFTDITAALPLGLTGDPAKGKWIYYVAVGIADVRSPSMMYPPSREGEPWLFDTVSDGGGAGPAFRNGKPVLRPLVVEGGS